jgi:hypothetical protein
MQTKDGILKLAEATLVFEVLSHCLKDIKTHRVMHARAGLGSVSVPNTFKPLEPQSHSVAG